MNFPDALRVVAMLASYFRQEVSDETAVLWARELEPFMVEDAIEAAKVCGSSMKFMPALTEFVEFIRDEEAHRRGLERLALPVGEEPTGDTRPPWVIAGMGWREWGRKEGLIA